MSKLMLGFHPFHMVSHSPWPLVGSLSILSLSASIIAFLIGGSKVLLVSSVSVTSFTACLWWRDVIREATGMGSHGERVVSGLQFGMLLFILSEIMFFFSLFFGWFFITLSPDPAIGCCVPPSGVQPLSFMSVPLLNTMILLSSGASVTWSHHAIIEGKGGALPLLVTCLLGCLFLGFQVVEYYEIPFTISDSVFGSLFFIATGFHGLHVLVGTCFLTVNLWRILKGHFSPVHHLGFEASAWYWHFVDVVWLFLFISIYWWGS
uniref:Cytochrome c oxidase subunit 3 n=1 Tax=Hoplopleura akanezumi TaxID=1511645 RepID=A0A075EB40_9NEOP|nr:cytochrome c oxidase subunit 3 [Hoplopleura akanezumi]